MVSNILHLIFVDLKALLNVYNNQLIVTKHSQRIFTREAVSVESLSNKESFPLEILFNKISKSTTGALTLV